jgi:hypothetical protein
MRYRLIVDFSDCGDGTAQANTVNVNGHDLPDTAIYLAWLWDGKTPISFSGGELAEGKSGEFIFFDGMVIDRVN